MADAEAAEAPKSEDPKNEAGEFPRNADYNIHVYIDKAKEMKTPPNDTIDPVFQIECLNLKQFSTSKDEIGGLQEVGWNEHLFLEPLNVDKRDAEGGKLTIRLLDKGLFKDALIGLYEFDLSYIYLKDKHCIEHKWLALNNPGDENYSEICGYVKVSISVTATGDEGVELKPQEEDDENPDILMSPSLNPTFYQVTIRCFQGQDLPPMDAGMMFSKAKIDAYIRVNFKDKVLKTKVKQYQKGGDPADFNTEFLLPCQMPVLTPYINLRLMDEDNLQDEMAGSISISTKDLIENEYMHNHFSWKSFYGSPLNQSNSKEKEEMNRNPDLASNWKGRILIQTIVEPCEKPKHKKQHISQDAIDQAQPYLENRKFKFIAQVGQAVALPSNKAYNIKITLGGHEAILEPMPQKNPSNYKRYGKTDVQEIELPFVNAADFGKVIFQLMDGDTPICFYIAQAKDFLTDKILDEDEKKKNEHGPPLQWVQFLPDMCVKTVKDPHAAGIFSFRMQIHDVTKNGDFDFMKKKVWRQKVAKRANPVKIRAYIYLCRGLPAADKSGTSDPYVVAWDTVPEVKKTEVIEDNNNPLYYETLELDYEVENQDDLESYPPFIFDCYDSDSGILDSTDDFLGRAIIEPEDCALITQEKLEQFNNDELAVDVEPRWHPFYYAAGEPKEGEILVAFTVVEHDYNFKFKPENVDLNSRVQKSEYDINILILGLRNLQSPGILPIKKAFIHFKCKSIVPAGTASISDVKTQPTSPGPNPTINTTIQIKIPLPMDQLYCPNMTCVVYDQIFKGWNQPQVGVFTLNIGELIEMLKSERKEETEVMFEILEKLKKIVENPDMAIPSYGGTAAQLQSQSTMLNRNNTSQDQDQSFYSGYSDDQTQQLKSSQDKNKKVRKRVQKELKGNEDGIELTEKLGANEETGNLKAQANKADQLKSQKDVKHDIMAMIHGAEQTSKMGSARLNIESGSEGGGDHMYRKNTLNKFEMIQKLKEAKEIEQSIMEDERKRAIEDMNRKGNSAVKVICKPQYEMDPRLKVMREVNQPSDKIFIGLGWDENETTNRKHYRQYFADELENKKDIFPNPSPFHGFDIMRGASQKHSSGGLFSTKKKDPKTQLKKVGYFKGIVQIASYPDRDAYRATKRQIIDDLKKYINDLSMKVLKKPMHIDSKKLVNIAARDEFETNMRQLRIDHLDISRHLVNLESDMILKQMLQKSSREIVRLYMVEAYDLSSRDNGSDSDPYLKIICNDQVVNERDNYQIDCSNPQFYKKYDFEGRFPGTSPVQIQVMDYDAVFGDELIGESILDVEDRFFNLEWVNLDEKPIEYRQIYHPSSTISQGVVKMWMEIIPADRKELTKEYDITVKPLEYFEVRICFLNCKDVKQDSQGMSDIYFRGFFDSAEEEQETDTHYRCSDGKPDFQYRFIFKIAVPRKDYMFNLQAWDRDFFSSNDMIGSAQIDLKKLVEDCALVKKPLSLNKKYYDEAMKEDFKSENKPEFNKDNEDSNKFWLKLMGKGEDGQISCHGQFRLQVNVLPITNAEKNPVGKARDNPNHSPALPQPEGRIELSINPLKMLNQFLGPEIMRKVYIGCCLAVCVGLFIMMFPMIMSQLLVSCLTACL